MPANPQDQELVFDINMFARQLLLTLVSGSLGTIFIAAVVLLYSKNIDGTLVGELGGWLVLSSINLGFRTLLYRKRHLQLFTYGSLERIRWSAALASGLVWGAAGLMFSTKLEDTGLVLISVSFILLNFTGIPTLYQSRIAFFYIWAPTWVLPAVALRASPHIIGFCAMGLTTLISAIFITYCLRNGIRELFQVNEKVTSKIELLHKDNQHLKLFFLAAGHDLAQPLSAIQSSISAFERRVGDDAALGASVAIMRTAATTLSHLIQDIIHFERIVSGIMRADFKPVPLQQVFDRVVAQTQHLAKAKEIGLWARDTRCEVTTDAFIVERILRNLVENALRYTREGSVIVAARPRGQHVSIEVWDTGVGIHADDLPKIFEVFYRRQIAMEMHHGYGLGLSIVKQLAGSIGAEITVKSVEGKGSVFRLLLPKVLHVSQLQPVGYFKGSVPSGTVEGMRIALLDDDLSFLHALALSLTDAGAIVTFATRSDFLAQQIGASGETFDVLITDWSLEAETGEDAYRSLLGIEGFTPRWIVMSGDLPLHVAQSLEQRKISVLRKPFETSDLLAMLKQNPIMQKE